MSFFLIWFLNMYMCMLLLLLKIERKYLFSSTTRIKHVNAYLNTYLSHVELANRTATPLYKNNTSSSPLDKTIFITTKDNYTNTKTSSQTLKKNFSQLEQLSIYSIIKTKHNHCIPSRANNNKQSSRM